MPLLHVQAGSADQLQDIADALWKAKKVVVITGAGISTNSGIPDFRSENGLYSMIQSQFDAAAKLSAPKVESSGAASDERPRKRRRTSPPVEDSIEVAPENLEAAALPVERDTTEAVGPADGSLTAAESSIKAATSRDDANMSTKVEPRIEGDIDEVTAQGDDEVMLLSEESILAGEHLLSIQDKSRDGGIGAREEVPDPPSVLKESNIHVDEQLKTCQAASRAASERQASRHTNPSETVASSPHPPEEKSSRFLQADRITTQHSGPPTPKPTSNPGPQTTSSSPLSSPPPAELFDSFDEHSTEPPPSSTRPSSPVSTENEDGDKDEDDDESEPSFSQSYLHRSSTFRRSLSTLKGKELFDASIWSDPLKTSVFYTFATNLRQKSRDAAPTGCHQFIGHLSKAGKMVRCYTQNIDLLEDKVGLSTRLLLGAGSRSRFSTRNSRGAAATPGGSGSRGLVNATNNNQPSLVPPNTCAGAATPCQPPVDGQAASQGASPSNTQGASAQLVEEADVDHRLTSSDGRVLVKGSSEQNGERCQGPEQDDATADPQPVPASSNDSEKPLLRADRGTSPEQDRGVECVFLHGSLRALRCFQCGCVTDWDDGRELQTMSGQQPPCPRCEDATNARQERGKRALGVGKLRPDIVLYGEDHPESHQISSIIQHDISLAPDMLIIMGTSLKVHGLKTVVREFAKTVHNRKDGKVIFVNYTKPAESVWADIIDFWVEMDCDSWVEDLKEKKPIIWLPPGSVESQPRSTIPKRRRTLNDEVGKEVKKSKKVDQTAKTATAAPPRDKVKRGVKVEMPTTTDAKAHVPKRPAAHRDCKQNAAYWTMKLVADLASMTGRVMVPGPPPYRVIPATQSVALPRTQTETQTSVPLKVRRGPRTKNTRSKVLEEAAAKSDKTAAPSSTGKEARSQAGSSVAKSSSKRRTKGGGAKEATDNAGTYTQDAVMTCKQDPDGKTDDNVLVEVPIPNSGPGIFGEDVPMVAAVKNRIRKPKVFYGDTDPPPVAPVRRGTPVIVNAKSKTKPAPQAKKAKAAKSEQTSSDDGTQSTSTGVQSGQMCILPVPKPRPQPLAVVTQPCPEPERSITLAPLRPNDCKPTNARRNSFFQMALGQSDLADSSTPPPAFLEPLVSPGPFDKSPQMSPNHWRKRAFSYSNALSRHFETPCRNLDFTSLGSGGAGDPAYMEYPRTVAQPPQQSVLVEAPPLLVGASVVPILSPPVEPLSMPDSPNEQLHRESEAAAALTQMAGYDQRQFAGM